jgi:hypothetical protein
LGKLSSQNSSNSEKNYKTELSPYKKYSDTILYPDSNFINNKEYYIEEKANELCEQYIKNVLFTNKKLSYLSETQYMTKNYKNAVLKELPGAPVGQHCMFSQYTQLKRAMYNLDEDTLKLIPDGAGTACGSFKNIMRTKYPEKHYKGAITEGKLYKSKQEFNADLEKYLKIKMIQESDSIRQLLTNKFSEKHFLADNMNPGTILIVPRTWNSTNSFHTIVYVGRGFMDNKGNFIKSTNGEFIFAANNRECTGDIFKYWNTNNVFMADIKKIAIAGFTKEIESLKIMNKDNLINYLSEYASDLNIDLQNFDTTTLVTLAYCKYFDKPINKPVNNITLNIKAASQLTR